MLTSPLKMTRLVASKAKKSIKLLKNRIFPRPPLDRFDLSYIYLKGQGIEIGALHNPLQVSSKASVKYVDRMPNAELKKHYAELNQLKLVPVDIIDDGETLSTIKDHSQDFVIANHFLEHCQNPIKTLLNMGRVLKKGGILYLALPDKRYTFDRDRPVTPIDHLIKDFQEGPAWSKQQHFEEWVTLVGKEKDPQQIAQKTAHLIETDYSIHYHVWTQAEMLELILAMKKFGLDVDIEVSLKNREEFILILKKNN